MIPFKEVAMLTSGLLARKGAAMPASLGLAPLPFAAPPGEVSPPPAPSPAPTATLRATPPASPRIESWPPLPFPARAAQRPAPAEAPAKELPPQPAVEVPAAEVLPTDGKLAKVSLRLDPARHLKLRLAAAHQRRSGQQILLAALDAYVDGIAAGVAGGDCVCLKCPSGT